MTFDILANATEPEFLGDVLKWGHLLWIIGGIPMLLFGIRQAIAIWDRVRNGTPNADYFVTRAEFRPLVRRVDLLEKDLKLTSNTFNNLARDLIREVSKISGILEGRGVK